jgi:hypothetical protein
MTLEALAVDSERPAFIRDLIKQWKSQIVEMEKKYKEINDIEVLDELGSIKGGLGHMKIDSKNKKLQKLVFNTLKENGDEDAKKSAVLMKDIYKKRGVLIHDGYLDSKVLKKAIRDSKSIVERVLKIKYLKIAKSEEFVD